MRRSAMQAVKSRGIVLVLFLAFSCGETPSPGVKTPAGEKGEVLVWVDESPITRLELEDALKRLGDAGLEEGGEALEKKVLESLIRTRAMAQARLNEMDAEEKARLERQVAAHREELLAKAYLMRHATPEGVTEQQARVYYAAHPEAFGGGVSRRYAVVMAEGGAADRQGLMRALEGFSGVGDWKAHARHLREKENLSLRYAEAGDDLAAYPAPLRALGRNLGPGGMTDLVLYGGVGYRLRLLEEEKMTPRPFEEVRQEIQGLLSPLEIRKALSVAAEKALDGVAIRYAEP